MNWLLLISFILVVWWVCGILNVAGVQAFSSSANKDFNAYYRSSTLWICFGCGPVLTLIAGFVLLARTPVKFGTRWGRAFGRWINPDNEE